MQNRIKQPILQIEKAFKFFNKTLFDNNLPDVVFTITRKKNAAGFFWASQWVEKETKKKGKVVHEMATNLSLMADWDIEMICTVLVHEMTHIQQEEFGTPAKGGWHNKEWGQMMKDVGLYPSNTGKEGGKEVGTQMFHYIIEGGEFQKHCNTLIKKGFSIDFVNRQETESEKAIKKQKKNSKTKYTCPSCRSNAWAKEGARLICGNCSSQSSLIFMKKGI